MPRLKNRLHERFCWLLAEGLNQTEAYRKLCPHVAHPADQGYQLGKKKEIRGRLAEIQAEVQCRAVMAIDAKRDVLRQMIEGTVPTKVIRQPDGRVQAIYDRLGALQTDAKIAGEYAADKLEVKGGDQISMTFEIYPRNHPAPPKHWMEATVVPVEPDAVPALDVAAYAGEPADGPSLDDLVRESEIGGLSSI
jgi:hypothetical protein